MTRTEAQVDLVVREITIVKEVAHVVITFNSNHINRRLVARSDVVFSNR